MVKIMARKFLALTCIQVRDPLEALNQAATFCEARGEIVKRTASAITAMFEEDYQGTRVKIKIKHLDIEEAPDEHVLDVTRRSGDPILFVNVFRALREICGSS